MATRTEDSRVIWNISGNDIVASGGREIGFFDIYNEYFQTMLIQQGTTGIFNFSDNRIVSSNGERVGIGKFGNKYYSRIGKFGNKYYSWRSALLFLLLLSSFLSALAYLGTSAATRGKLSGATILINYDGSWVNSTYQNCKTKAILVTDQITLEELQNKVYDIINVEPNEYEITMIVIYESVKSTWLAKIADDNDVRAFIFESLLWYYKMPLCISLKHKASNKQAPSVDFGQESRSVNPNLGTQADLKDNEQYHHDLKDDLGNENFEGTEYKVENSTTELGEFLRENMQCKDMAFVHVDADNMFQDNAEFNELPPANTVCDDVPMCNLTRMESDGEPMGAFDLPLPLQSDEPYLDKSNILEYLRMNILQKWFYKRRNEAAKINTFLTEWELVRENNMKRLSL
ncbi:hypothetical protein ACE6H2_013953 [Prunus campanulata]